MKYHFGLTLFVFLQLILAGCSPSAVISKQANQQLLHSPELENAHVGIYIYDATENKSIYKYQSNKYFIPASNTKLFTCYAAMKHLADSLPGILYSEDDTALYLLPTGDPTLLHKDYAYQPVIDFLKKENKKIYVTNKNWKENALGFGWSWDDYNSDYMAERSSLPVYGNVIKWVQERDSTEKNETNQFDNLVSIYSIPEVNWKVRFNPENNRPSFYVRRNKDANEFVITEGKELKREQEVPFITNDLQSAVELMKDTIGRDISIVTESRSAHAYAKIISSQPLDSFLSPMMHRSDNFFAEQALLMVSQRLIGMMNTAAIIDTLLKTDLKDIPQWPRWVDGSGLSRFNLFTPEDFVWLLNKMKSEFGIDRLKKILATGGTGTLSNFFKDANGYLFAKTGTLSGQIALSGFLYTKKDRLLTFSILVGNHNGSTLLIRRQTEAFLRAIRDKY